MRGDGRFYREGKEGWRRVEPVRVRVEDTASILAEKERKAKKKKIKSVWCGVGGRMGTRMGQGWFKVRVLFVFLVQEK